MKITKKIIALAMAGVMALSVVPVASPAPVAKAAAMDADKDVEINIGATGTGEITLTGTKEVVIKRLDGSTKITPNITDANSGDPVIPDWSETNGISYTVGTNSDTLKFKVDKTASAGDVAHFSVTIDGTEKKYGVKAKDASEYATATIGGINLIPAENASFPVELDSYVTDTTNALVFTNPKAKDGTTTVLLSATTKMTLTSSDASVAYFKDGGKDVASLSVASLPSSTNVPLYTGNAGKITLTASITDADGAELISKIYYINVKQNASGNIKAISYVDSNGDTQYVKRIADFLPSPNNTAINSASQTVSLNTLDSTKNSIQLTPSVIENTSFLYESNNETVATVDTTGKVTAVGAGSATITCRAKSTKSFLAEEATFTVAVSDTVSTDTITLLDANDRTITKVDLDLSTSTSENAIKSYTVKAKSGVGATPEYKLVADTKGTALSGNAAQIATLASGVITSGTLTGTVYLEVKTTSTAVTTDNGVTTKYYAINVTDKPEDTLDVPSAITLNLSDNKTFKFTAKGAAESNAVNRYTLTTAGVFDATAGEVEASTISSITEGVDGEFTVTAKAIGKTTIMITEAATTTTRETSKYIKINIGEGDIAKDADLVAPSYVKIKVGETYTLAPSSEGGAAITFGDILDSSIASIDKATGIITGLSEGITSVAVSAASTATMKAGSKDVTIIVEAASASPAKKSATIKASKTSLKASALKKKAQKVTIKVTGSKGKVTVKNTTSKKLKKYVKISGKKVTTLVVKVVDKKLFSCFDGYLCSYDA